MELGALYNTFCSLAGDHAVPPLFAKNEVFQWFNEAEREAANRARLLHDTLTPDVTQLPLLVGERNYRLHPAVFDVSAVRLLRPGSNGQMCGLKLADAEDMRWTTTNRPNLIGWAGYYYVYGEPSGDGFEGMFFQLDRKPAEINGLLYLDVFRYPLQDMEEDSDEPEIAPRHHDGLVDWVLHRAYSTRDIEGSAPQRSDKHLAAFEARFGLRQDANVQRKQRAHHPKRVKAIRF